MGFLSVSMIAKKGLGDFKLQDITFSQHKNQKIAIAGETGSGKSTLLKIIAGLEQPDSGEVIFRDEQIEGPNDNLVPGHPRIAYLTQDFELPKFLRVEQVLSYANKLTHESASALFDVCEISHLLERKTDQLSGGEKQRIALAKLLIASPTLLLLDEPYSNLDMVHKNILKDVLRRISKQLKITFILVSHDPSDILPWADKIIVMKGGRVIQAGAPKHLYKQPANEYVAGLLVEYNFIPVEESSDFFRMWGMKEKRKHIIIRPEHLRVSEKKSQGLPGVVDEINFYGAYYHTKISINDLRLTFMSKKNKFEEGEAVYVNCSPKNVRFVKVQ
jgi:ABC-type sugar transport system ATPase subunit